MYFFIVTNINERLHDWDTDWGTAETGLQDGKIIALTLGNGRNADYKGLKDCTDFFALSLGGRPGTGWQDFFADAWGIAGTRIIKD
jgi:hypothetical protein